tara:strand:+ start:35939 stop:41308 length:5370 start_codon:yes stop_codon:yes gene_type:complete
MDMVMSSQKPLWVPSLDRTNSKESYSYTEDGVSVFIDQNRAQSSMPKTKNIISMAPEAVILVKKKAFSSLKSSNDLKWMDRTEKLLLRSTKALFAYKVAQIRAYEALTKLDDFYEKYSQVHLAFFADFLYNTQFLTVPVDGMRDQLDLLKQDFINIYGPPNSWSADARTMYQVEVSNLTNGNSSTVDSSQALDIIMGAAKSALADVHYERTEWMQNEDRQIKETVLRDIMSMIKRNSFSDDHHLTSWIVDPSASYNYDIGPGTGVIEITAFTTFNTSCRCDTRSPSSASFTMEDPYRLTNILDDDIEIAIQEALNGTIGLMKALTEGDPNMGPVDGASIAAAGIEMLGLGSLDSTLDVDYIRDRLRTFYLGKPFINPADGVHFLIRGNRSTQDYSNNGTSVDSSNPIDWEENAVDDVILEAERRLYTDENLNLDVYRKMRNNSSLSMMHVFGGFVTRVTQNYSGGMHRMSVTCTDNLGWLEWSRVMLEPALQDPQGVLEDPLTPFVIVKDEQGKIDSTEAPELLSENKHLLGTGLLSYDSGLLNGQFANESNLVQGQYNYGGSLRGGKIIQHPNGLVYRWKDGIITATAGLTSSDPMHGEFVALKQHARNYGLNIAQDVLNNLDIANVLSVLIVGQPYNIETFMQQAFEAGSISSPSSTHTNPMDAMYAVLNSVKTQNSRFGNFRPYRMITMSSQSTQQATNNSINRNKINSNIEKLQRRKADLFNKISKLNESFPSSGNTAGAQNPLATSLMREVEAIQAGIKLQSLGAYDENKISSRDALVSNFNLFGTNRVLPFTGDYEADHQVTRAMTIVGAQRRVEDIRLNVDDNLFIVSDQYDNNTDIRAYIFKLNNSGWSIWQGKFYSPLQKCAQAARWLDLELFCNPAGHIEFRPPQWNKTPLTVLQELIRQKKYENKNVIPDFLENLFDTRIASIKKDIHTLNIKIALISLLLGYYPDKSVIPGMPVNGSLSLDFFGISVDRSGVRATSISGVGFRDSKDKSGSITGSLFNLSASASIKQSEASEGDIIDADTESQIGMFDPLTQETSGLGIINNIFGSQGNAEVAVRPGKSSEAKSIATIASLNNIRDSYKKRIGVDPLYDVIGSGKIAAEHFMFVPADAPAGHTKDTSRAFDLLKKLEVAVSTRDNHTSILKRNVDKEKELRRIEAILETGEQNLLDRTQGPVMGADVQDDFDSGNAVDIRDIHMVNSGRFSGYVRVVTAQKIGDDQYGRGISNGDYIQISGVGGVNGDIVNGEHYVEGVQNGSSSTSFVLTLTSGESILGPIGAGDGFLSSSRQTKSIDGITTSNARVVVSDSLMQGRGVGIIKGLYNAATLTRDIFTGDATKGSLFDHLIEDDTKNLLGPGSGKRFIINDDTIISANLSESPPDFTRVNVTGDAPIIGDAFKQAFQGVAFWAGGTDFDLWRQYGYKPRDFDLPFANDAEMQCRPYAVLELQKQRTKVNKGTVTVVGNEYYQPGDTIYLSYKGLLYYVTAVSHRFTIGSSFTTTLTLEYGHPPGDYLPSPLDVIGQQYVGNPLYENFLVYRSNSGDDSYTPLQPDSAIVFPPKPKITESNISTLLDHKENQTRYYNMMTNLSTMSVGNRYVLLRGFYCNDKDKSDVTARLAIIRNMLVNPVQLSQGQELGNSAGNMSGGLADDFADSIFRDTLPGLFGVNSTKNTVQMVLPNGMTATPIDEARIIEQIVNLRPGGGGSTEFEIECMDKSVFQPYTLDDRINTIYGDDTPEDAKERERATFPVGGPRQSGWSDVREEVVMGNDRAVSRIIEVGLIDIS